MAFFNIKDTVKALKEGTVTSAQLVKDSIDTFEKDKASAIPLNAFLEMYSDAAEKAEAADKEIAEAKAAGTLDDLYSKKPLLGVPFAVKDNISVKGQRLTCGSSNKPP